VALAAMPPGPPPIAMNHPANIQMLDQPASQNGQAIVEYSLILSLVAVACVFAVGTIGDRVVTLFNQVLPFP
jgi:Flp pilus assembly pilin Flp